MVPVLVAVRQPDRLRVIKAMIDITHLSKIYSSEGTETVALDDISFSINKGEFVAIMGPSGSGKSTLMHILGCLDSPTKGKYILDGEEVNNLSDDELADIRNQKIGFVFQSYNLLPRTTALKNVMLPMTYGGVDGVTRQKKAEELLKLVGLGERMKHTSNQLSGGQQQRVAIARSLAMNPAIILADEPTGNLATAQGEEIIRIFQDLNDQGHTVIIITHEPNIAEHAKRIITVRDGKIISNKPNKQKKINGAAH